MINWQRNHLKILHYHKSDGENSTNEKSGTAIHGRQRYNSRVWVPLRCLTERPSSSERTRKCFIHEIHSAAKMWHLLAVWKKKRSEKYLEQNVEVMWCQLHQQKSGNYRWQLVATPHQWLHCSLPAALPILVLLNFFFYFLRQATNNDQTQNPVILCSPRDMWMSLLVGAFWSDCGLKCTSVLHVEKEKTKLKHNSSSVFTLKLPRLWLCLEPHCSQMNWN